MSESVKLFHRLLGASRYYIGVTLGVAWEKWTVSPNASIWSLLRTFALRASKFLRDGHIELQLTADAILEASTVDPRRYVLDLLELDKISGDLHPLLVEALRYHFVHGKRFLVCMANTCGKPADRCTCYIAYTVCYRNVRIDWSLQQNLRKSQKRCGKCGVYGHTRRTCTDDLSLLAQHAEPPSLLCHEQWDDVWRNLSETVV